MPSTWLKKLSVVAVKKTHDAKLKSKHDGALKKRPAFARRSKRNFALRLPNAVRLKKKFDGWRKKKHNGAQKRRRIASPPNMPAEWLRPKTSVARKKKLGVRLHTLRACTPKKRSVAAQRSTCESMPNVPNVNELKQRRANALNSKLASAPKSKPKFVLKKLSKEKFKMPRGVRQSTNGSSPRKQRRKLCHRNMFLKLSVVRPRSSLNQPRNLTITLALDTTTELSSNPSAFRTKVSQMKKFRRLRLTLSQAINLRNEQPR